MRNATTFADDFTADARGVEEDPGFGAEVQSRHFGESGKGGQLGGRPGWSASAAVSKCGGPQGREKEKAWGMYVW